LVAASSSWSAREVTRPHLSQSETFKALDTAGLGKSELVRALDTWSTREQSTWGASFLRRASDENCF
jgi:hypothetical protein